MVCTGSMRQYRLIKVLGEKASAIPGGSGATDSYFFHRALFGVMSAENIGGPQIYRAGKLLNHETGKVDHYIEMEEIFAGKPSFTFKATRFRQANIVQVLTEHHDVGSLAEQMGRLVARITERKIILDLDFDFIFSSSEARWIDTGGWTYSHRPEWSLVMDPIRAFIRHRLMDGELSDQFVTAFLREIELSPKLSLSDKVEIKQALDGIVEW